MLMEYYSETLTKVGLQYMQARSNFAAGQVFPNCPVNLISGTYPTYDKTYWMKNEAKVRAPGTESAGSPHARGTDSYACEDVSFHDDVPFENIKNDPKVLNPESAATRRVTNKIDIYDEVDFTSNFFTTGIWGTDLTPSTLWNAASGSDPLGDIDTAKQTVKKNTGFDPNRIAISREVYDVLKRHSSIKEQIKYTSSRNVTAELLAYMFEVDKVIILNGVYDSAKYGATASQGFIGGQHCLVYHASNGPSLEEPSAGYRFVWNGYGSDGFGVESRDKADNKAVRVEAHNYRDFKLVAADLGYMLNNVLA